ncbi:MAG: serine/threonine protein kinase [Oscillochloris sp.]|nr:serine/threonine protein kinase [Oscillochloris sp.]
MRQLPRRAGRFELMGRLGSGGQAEVFLARPIDAGRQAGRAALKVAHPNHSAGLHDEHGWLASPRADHPGLPQLYSQRYGGTGDLGYLEQPGSGWVPFLAMAYLPGQNLEQLLAHRRGRSLPLDLAFQIASQIAAVLEHLHRRLGIVHHDVRPANILIGPGRQPRITLLDLGAAESMAAPRRTWDYGTPGYTAPERAIGAACSPLADIYSLGVTLRVMLGGQPIPPTLADLIHDATEHNPQRRAYAIPDMAALRGRLAGWPAQSHQTPGGSACYTERDRPRQTQEALWHTPDSNPR